MNTTSCLESQFVGCRCHCVCHLEKMNKNHVWLMFCFMERGLRFQFLRWELKSRPVFGQLTRWNNMITYAHWFCNACSHRSFVQSNNCPSIKWNKNWSPRPGYVILIYDLLLLFINYLWLSLRKLHLAQSLWISWFSLLCSICGEWNLN